ncbi:MAG: YqiA/YcfP family alpha/beta fold hydrolase [Pseudomonadota bacterium]|nr:YqiA/YcfP family alpha/beta fold hydrolase [Pseudomonadota bacterium]
MLLYIHGFNSSSRSGKALELGDWLDQRGLGVAYVCPDLPHRPAAAIQLLDDLIVSSRSPVKLIGSSLGGFYATWLVEKHGHERNIKAILVNPCVACHGKLAGLVGQTQKNWHSGEEYLFSAEHAAELNACAVAAITRPERYLLLAETGDAVLDYREAVGFYAGAQQVVLAGGDHGFSRFTDTIPAILAF